MSGRALSELSPPDDVIYYDEPHEARYYEGAPNWGPRYDEDTGLRCWCGREVVAVDDDDHPSGWAHVGEP